MSKFRLERVRRMRALLEKKRRQEIAIVISEKEAKARALEQSQQSHEQMRRHFYDELKSGVKAAQWSMMLAALDYYTREEGRLQHQLEKMHPFLQKARFALAAASRDLEVMNRLKDSWLARQRELEGRDERRVLDEIGLREAWLRDSNLEPVQRGGEHA
jgi:flagellar export protein FliJ